MDIKHRILQGRGLAGFTFSAMKGDDAVRMLLDKTVNDLAGAVFGAVIDRNDDQFVLGIINFQQSAQDVGNNRFFVVGCDQHGDRGPVSGINIYIGMPLSAHHPVQRETEVPYRVDADK